MSYVGPFPLEPKQGGTGDTTLTVNGVLIGKGVAPVSSLVNALNGQLIIGNTGNAPSVANLTSIGGTITISNGPGTINLEGGSSSEVNYRLITNSNSPYAVTGTDYYISCDTSTGAIQVNLPNTTLSGRLFIIKDFAGDATSSNITVTTPGGSVTLDGSPTFLMISNYQANQFIFNGTNYEIF